MVIIDAVGVQDGDLAGAGEGDIKLAVFGEGDAVGAGEGVGRSRGVDMVFDELGGGGECGLVGLGVGVVEIHFDDAGEGFDDVEFVVVAEGGVRNAFG